MYRLFPINPSTPIPAMGIITHHAIGDMGIMNITDGVVGTLTGMTVAGVATMVVIVAVIDKRPADKFVQIENGLRLCA